MADGGVAYQDMAATAVRGLVGMYDREAGVWPKCWWQSANALEALVDYMALSGDRAHEEIVGLTFERAQAQAAGFLNKYYDDEGWWALT
ncbi:MAG: glycoside hydrolase family 76 protein, partial [Gemmatimonadota bacterium]